MRSLDIHIPAPDGDCRGTLHIPDGGLVSVLTNEAVIADAGAYADFLLARPEVSGSAIGTTGYCLGGHMSLIAAGGLLYRTRQPR